MDLHKLQEQVREWTDRNFPNSFPEGVGPLMGATEEVGELTEALGTIDPHALHLFTALARIHHAKLKLFQGIRLEENHRENIEDAVGDVVVFLADFCNQNNIDLAKTVEWVWANVRDRDWVENPKEGGAP